MTTQSMSKEKSASRRIDPESAGLPVLLIMVCAFFGTMSGTLLSPTTFTSIAFQLSELGLLTLAMLMPIISGGFNLAVTFTANLSGLAMAAVLHAMGGADAGTFAIMLGIFPALATGSAVGALMGAIIAITGAHPILVSLSMMIFVRGLGEFLTRDGDISGTPDAVQAVGQGNRLRSACFLGGVDPFGGFGRVVPVAIALIILQVIASGLNLMDANQHLATALRGGFLLLIMVARSIWASRFLQSLFCSSDSDSQNHDT